MTYETIYKDFLSLFIEDIILITSMEKAVLVDQDDGRHVQFGMVVVPYIIYLVNNKENCKLSKIFGFIEDMLDTNDVMVCEVVEYTILENLLSENKKILDYCKKFMKTRTIQSCYEVEKYIL